MKTLSNIFSIICGISVLGFGLSITIRTILNIGLYDFTSFMVYTSVGLLLAFLGVCVPVVSWEK